VKGSIGSNGDSCRNGGPGHHVGSSYVELLTARQSQLGGKNMAFRTLQKSMLFTPLLPNAGPTGGLGLAWPAPTINFTI